MQPQLASSSAHAMFFFCFFFLIIPCFESLHFHTHACLHSHPCATWSSALGHLVLCPLTERSHSLLAPLAACIGDRAKPFCCTSKDEAGQLSSLSTSPSPPSTSRRSALQPDGHSHQAPAPVTRCSSTRWLAFKTSSQPSRAPHCPRSPWAAGAFSGT